MSSGLDVDSVATQLKYDHDYEKDAAELQGLLVFFFHGGIVPPPALPVKWVPAFIFCP